LDRANALLLTIGLKRVADLLDGPVQDSIGSVVEHLADHFAPNSRIGAAFHLDQRRDTVLIEEKVIK
jgi:hypothetical protein